MIKPRDESHILRDLAALACSPGYVHAIAFMCHRDNVIHVKGTLKPSDMDRLFTSDRLIRTEVMTLLGLMVKKPLDLSPQPKVVINSYVDRTDKLMRELHDAISYPVLASMLKAIGDGVELLNPWCGQGMREPIFYGAESAYAFQYRDFVPEKFGADDAWLIENKGFTSTEARTIAKTMCTLMDNKGTELLKSFTAGNDALWSWLPAFEFSLDEVVFHSGVNQPTVQAFFEAFLYSGYNEGFKEVGDFNEVAARPLIPTGHGTVLLFLHYAIYEALYESPFFWMWDDKAYRPKAATHRGAFLEKFAARRLASTFGHEHVYTNVNLYCGKDIVGEVDVLVIYGDRLIILQAKTKKLTIAARKGNDNQLKADFAAAIQDSYDQGWVCANKLLSGGCRLVGESMKDIALPASIKDIFLFSLVSEHYPALAFQARQSLKFQTTDVIGPPFVMDVFLLDALAEMLSTPLRFLSYVKLRLAVSDKLMSGQELNVLGYHLKENLWLNENHDLVMIDDSCAQDLDAAMLVRRDDLQGDDTPVGILTKMRGTHYERLIQDIENSENPAILELGLHLLSMSEESCRNVHLILETIMRRAQIDGNRHDATLASSTPPVGVTFHCNPRVSNEAIAALEAYCTKRKYQQRAAQWFGVSVSPTGQVQFGVTLAFPWEQSDEMELLTADMKPASKVSEALPSFLREGRLMKLGRNDPCYCGSGRKYKKCCFR